MRRTGEPLRTANAEPAGANRGTHRPVAQSSSASPSAHPVGHNDTDMNFRPRTPVKVATVLCTGAALACASTGLAADTGGSEFQSGGAGQAARHALLGNPVAFRGEARRGSRVAVQRLGPGAWGTPSPAAAQPPPRPPPDRGGTPNRGLPYA